MSVNSVSTFLATGAILIGAGVATLIVLLLLAWRIPAAKDLLDRVGNALAGYGLWLAWLMALVATLGSLYYSQVAHFVPCEYCWYQRIAMYPLAVIIGIAAFRGDATIRRYVYPLAITGGIISGYHYLIQQMPTLAAGSCSTATPCTAALVWKFEFVSIPLMALVSFTAIITMLIVDREHKGTTTGHNASTRSEGAA